MEQTTEGLDTILLAGSTENVVGEVDFGTAREMLRILAESAWAYGYHVVNQSSPQINFFLDCIVNGRPGRNLLTHLPVDNLFGCGIDYTAGFFVAGGEAERPLYERFLAEYPNAVPFPIPAPGGMAAELFTELHMTGREDAPLIAEAVASISPLLVARDCFGYLHRDL